MGNPTYEDKLARLTAVVEELESGDVPLERGVELYKEGLTLARDCSRRLQEAQNEVTRMGRDLAAFDPDELGGEDE
ncbi:Exodeoxyribonuclease VII small subunit [Paucidesulfovibrio gracilis DSM 16080]|uniref:Exodeoxyribonuclease 7 small subunit n=1 Tax=Paucidesulfovibrio gracilis DSM 16080 TaxID=1121449 RepID=A0A1T4W4D0_9BACT|nr:exodeoxyribonuclease VII small subunit [Paucidesulfovibrio gracilis]SKA72120.1 Exodeoxyribonuclease VII small subunit [Paucidesulfovibrio gracilis DSM 16080]